MTSNTKGTVPPGGSSPLTITTTSLAVATIGESYLSQQLTATGGTRPYHWMVTGLPDGLTSDSQSGAIGGTPSSSAVTSVVAINVTDSGQPAQKASTQMVLTVHHPPLAPAVPDSTPLGTPVVVTLVPPASDPDGSAVTVTGVGPVSPAGAGTVSNNNVSATFDPANGFSGHCTFTYTVTAHGDLTASNTVTMTVINTAPVAPPVSANLHMTNATSLANGTAGILVKLVPPATDPDGSPVTVTSLGPISPAAAAGSVSVNATKDGADFVPAKYYVGSATFSYTVAQGAETATSTVTVAVADNAPAAPPQTVHYSSSTTTVALIPPANDPDGDPISITAVGSAANNQSGQAAPFSVVVDSSNPSDVEITENMNDCGSLFDLVGTFTYTVSDGALSKQNTVTATPIFGCL